MCDAGEIDLGFAEKYDAAWLTNRYFPSKVGGRPAWLELEMLPPKEQLQCPKCKSPQSFLCQLYAPYDEAHNFHRSIFVFICRNADCQVANSADNITVLRSQLARSNKFYSIEAPKDDGEPLEAIPALKKLCCVCGCAGPLMCSRCKKANYCAPAHQRAHWKTHKPECGTDTAVAPAEDIFPGIIFPEYEIVMESTAANSNDNKHVNDDELEEQARIAEYEKLAAEGKTGELADVPDAELDKYTASADAVDDKFFRRFKKTIASEPEQIIRYKRGGAPLWIADLDETIAAQTTNIPNCSQCGGKRQFEFQIMPQLLTLLHDEHLDWGVLAVYTCTRSCAIEGGGYVPEYVVKQDILPAKD